MLHLFGRQKGVASTAQLRQHVTARQMRRGVVSGLFEPELPGVKRLAGVQVDLPSRVMALSLYAGQDGFVSGMAAARQHGVQCVPLHYLELMIRDEYAPDLPTWVTTTRTSWRVGEDRQELSDGRVVASPLRSLFRCGATCSDVRFEKIAEQMWNLQLITPHEAAAYLAIVRRQGRSGVVRFETWLEKAIERPGASQSTLEVDLAAAIRPLGIPEPQRQFPLTLPGGEVIHLDLAWPDAQLGVEPGSTFWHGGDAKVRSDHGRDRGCDEIGWRVLRFDEVELRDVRACARQVVAIYRKRKRLQQFGGEVTLGGSEGFAELG